MRIAVVGLGKIGLPCAVQYASKGNTVYGIDISEHVVQQVNSGESPFPGEEGLPDLLRAEVGKRRLSASVDFGEIEQAEVVVVAVPLIINADGVPDFSSVDRATEGIGRYLQPRSLVIYETTLPIGTTRNRLSPALEKASGLTSGSGFHLVFSPERVSSGRVFRDFSRYPKIVGPLEPEGGRKAFDFYTRVFDYEARPDLERPNGVWVLDSPESAEMVKLAETTYRDVNIALANQFAQHALMLGVDFESVRNAANSQPFSHIHSPGISVGGHCIPVYPHLYLDGNPDASLVRLARQINQSMPNWCIQVLNQSLGSLNGVRVLVLGVAYRAGVKETAFSGVFDVCDALHQLGAVPLVYDPLFSDEEIRSLGLKPLTEGEKIEAIVVQNEAPEFGKMKPSDFPEVRAAFDGRGILSNDWPGLIRLAGSANDEKSSS